MLTSGFALYSLLYLDTVWSAVAICAQVVSVLAIAMVGYDHGRKLAGATHGYDAVQWLLLGSMFIAVLASAVAAYVLLERFQAL